MSDLRTAAQQALEALEDISNCHVGDYDLAGECASCHEVSYKPHSADCKKQNSIDALRAALAQHSATDHFENALDMVAALKPVAVRGEISAKIIKDARAAIAKAGGQR